jgi:hypothetical protein
MTPGPDLICVLKERGAIPPPPPGAPMNPPSPTQPPGTIGHSENQVVAVKDVIHSGEDHE